MNYIANIQRTLDFMESNINEDITLDQLASMALFSKFHYHRIFLAMVGCPVMGYLKKRRLTEAAGQLTGTRKKIFDIAINCGFNSQSAFNRAFMRQYGVTPGEYRRSGRDITLYEPVRLDECLLDTPYKSYLYGPKIIYIKERTVIGQRCTATFDANIKDRVIPNFWKDFRKKIGVIHNCENHDTLYGAIYGSDKKGYFDYVASAEVSSVDFVPEGMEARVIGGSKYAAFTYSGSVDTQKIYNLYSYIYKSWFLNSKYTRDKLKESIEILDNQLTKSELTICIPIH